FGGHRRPAGWIGNRPDPHATDTGCFSDESDEVHRGNDRAGKHSSYRRLAGIRASRRERLRSRGHLLEGKEGHSLGVHSSRTSGGIVIETLAARTTPRRGDS